MHDHQLSIPTPLSERELQTRIEQELNNKFTGQIRLSFLNNKTATIFVLQGGVRQIYIRNHRVPDLEWATPILRYGRGTLTVDPMPARAMLFRKIVLEEITPTSPQRSNTNQLKLLFSLAEHNNTPTLFQLQWEYAEGFVLVAGKGLPIRQAVMLTKAGAEEGLVALNQLSAWEEAQCNVTIRRGDIKSQAWLEVHLNLLLEWHCRNVLKQYGQLTGSVMVRSILHNIAMLAARKGWAITMFEQQLTDATIFLSAAEAGNAYREILSFTKLQMEAIIGSALTRELLKQSKGTVRDVYRTVEEAFGLIEEAA